MEIWLKAFSDNWIMYVIVVAMKLSLFHLYKIFCKYNWVFLYTAIANRGKVNIFTISHSINSCLARSVWQIMWPEVQHHHSFWALTLLTIPRTWVLLTSFLESQYRCYLAHIPTACQVIIATCLLSNIIHKLFVCSSLNTQNLLATPSNLS